MCSSSLAPRTFAVSWLSGLRTALRNLPVVRAAETCAQSACQALNTSEARNRHPTWIAGPRSVTGEGGSCRSSHRPSLFAWWCARCRWQWTLQCPKGGTPSTRGVPLVDRQTTSTCSRSSAELQVFLLDYVDSLLVDGFKATDAERGRHSAGSCSRSRQFSASTSHGLRERCGVTADAFRRYLEHPFSITSWRPPRLWSS